MGKTTVVVGASPNPDRYSYRATVSLKSHGHKVYPVGIRSGKIDGEEILTNKPPIEGVDTVTMYVGPQNQAVWQDYILNLKPKRIIFNPGAENEVLEKAAKAHGIDCVEACTLVMLAIGDY
jgi:uncharacterized protein